MRTFWRRAVCLFRGHRWSIRWALGELFPWVFMDGGPADDRVVFRLDCKRCQAQVIIPGD